MLRAGLAIFLLIAWCPPAPAAPAGRVVATTTFVGDLVRRVADGAVDVRTLLPEGTDPHGFQPTPRDAVLLADADLIFINGAGLEEHYLPGLLRGSRTKARLVDLSEHLSLRTLGEEDPAHAGHDPGEFDPHVWLDPLLMREWAQEIAQRLSERYPEHAAAFAAAAQKMRASLEELNRWAVAKSAELPEDQRWLVADHDSLGYLADRYGFSVAGAIIPGFTAGAEPAPRELAEVEDLIRAHRVRAIFVGLAPQKAIARRVAQDTGARLVELNTGSLEAGQRYEDFFRSTLGRIVESLK